MALSPLTSFCAWTVLVLGFPFGLRNLVNLPLHLSDDSSSDQQESLSEHRCVLQICLAYAHTCSCSALSWWQCWLRKRFCRATEPSTHFLVDFHVLREQKGQQRLFFFQCSPFDLLPESRFFFLKDIIPRILLDFLVLLQLLSLNRSFLVCDLAADTAQLRRELFPASRCQFAAHSLCDSSPSAAPMPSLRKPFV